MSHNSDLFQCYYYFIVSTFNLIVSSCDLRIIAYYMCYICLFFWSLSGRNGLPYILACHSLNLQWCDSGGLVVELRPTYRSYSQPGGLGSGPIGNSFLTLYPLSHQIKTKASDKPDLIGLWPIKHKPFMSSAGLTSSVQCKSGNWAPDSEEFCTSFFPNNI